MNQTGNKTAPVSLLNQRKYLIGIGVILGIVAIVYGCVEAFSRDSTSVKSIAAAESANNNEKDKTAAVVVNVLDTAAYKQKLIANANRDSSGRWPVAQDYPLPGAILPFKRIVAFYSNLYSTRM